MSTPDDTRAGLGWPSAETTADEQRAGAVAGLGWPTEYTPTPTAETLTGTSSPRPDTTAAATDHPEESA